MSLTVPTWIGALATAVLAGGAGFTVYYAKQAFGKQSSSSATCGMCRRPANRAVPARRRRGPAPPPAIARPTRPPPLLASGTRPRRLHLDRGATRPNGAPKVAATACAADQAGQEAMTRPAPGGRPGRTGFPSPPPGAPQPCPFDVWQALRGVAAFAA